MHLARTTNFIWFGCLILVASCRVESTDDPIIRSGTKHPTPANIPGVDEVTHTLRPSSSPQTFFIPIPSDSIGKDSGEDYEMIGAIEALEVDDTGRIFILDAPLRSEFVAIHVYDYTGQHITSFGEYGEGPGQLRYAYELEVTRDGTLVAILGGTGKAEIFRRNDTGSAYAYSHSVGGVGMEGCMMNGHIYTLGYRENLDGEILKYTLDGDLVASFGAPYISDNPIVVGSFSRNGFLACSEEYGVVGWIRQVVPVFTGFDEEGTELWKILFPEFAPTPVVETVSDEGLPALMYNAPEEGQSRFSRILVDENGEFYVSYTVFPEEGPAPRHLFRVAPESGRGQYIGEVFHTLYAIDEEHIVYRIYSDAPRVGIAKRY